MNECCGSQTMIGTIINNLISGICVLIIWFVITRWENIKFFITSFYGTPENNLIIRWHYRWIFNHNQRQFFHKILVISPIAQTSDPLSFDTSDTWEIKQLKTLEDMGLVSIMEIGSGIQQSPDQYSIYNYIVFSYALILKPEFYNVFKLRGRLELLKRRNLSDEQIYYAYFCKHIMGMKVIED